MAKRKPIASCWRSAISRRNEGLARTTFGSAEDPQSGSSAPHSWRTSYSLENNPNLPELWHRLEGKPAPTASLPGRSIGTLNLNTTSGTWKKQLSGPNLSKFTVQAS